MKTIDLTLFEGEGFEIKTKTRTYAINFVSSVMELKFLQEQENITKKSRDFKTLEQQDLEKWKHLIKNSIKENGVEDLDEGDINSLKPFEVLAVMIGYIQFLTERSQVIYQGLSDKTKKEIEEITDDIKKKEMNKALSE